MKIAYDSQLRVAGIGVYPWSRIGPQAWFPQYKIASLFDWDIDNASGLNMHSLLTYAGKNCHSGKENTQALLENPLFQRMLKECFYGYTMLTYKPVDAPSDLAGQGVTLLPTKDDAILARQFENKMWFRQRFSHRGINVPKYQIYQRKDLDITEKTLQRILGDSRKVVLQDPVLSGGKGTFIIEDLASLECALSTLKSRGKDDSVVVSEYILGGYERSIQGVVTRYGTFVGPMQQQIIANPSLTNVDLPGSELFCGIQVSMNDAALWAYDQQKQYALVVGRELQEAGYRGIFGVDSLVTDDTVYTIEVNPRITSATPLLMMSYRPDKHIPFYLLHMLELMDADYRIIDASYDNNYDDCALLVAHSLRNEDVVLSRGIRSGLYTPSLEYRGPHAAFDMSESDSPQFLLQSYSVAEKKIKAGGRVLSGFTNHSIINSNSQLTAEVQEILELLLTELGVNDNNLSPGDSIECKGDFGEG